MKQLAYAALSAVFMILLSSAIDAKAQDPIMALDPTLMAGWTGNTAGVFNKNAGRTRVATVKTNFAYTSSPALRQRVVTTFAQRLQSANPQGAQTLKAAFGPGKTDYGQVYSQMLKTSALRDNNAADALTGLLVTGYEIVNNLADNEVTASLERGARGQVSAILSQNPHMTSASTRAQVGEEFKLQTVLLASGWLEAVKAKTLPAYQQSIASMFKNQYGIDMKQLKLIANGFVKK